MIFPRISARNHWNIRVVILDIRPAGEDNPAPSPGADQLVRAQPPAPELGSERGLKASDPGADVRL